MRTVLLLVATMSLIPCAAALDEGAGPAEVQVDSGHVPHCVVNVASEACLLAWDHGDDPNSVSDDNLTVTRPANRATVTIEDPQLGEHQEIVFNASDVRVNHPAWHVANQTWIMANDSLPDAVKTYVTLDSRDMHEAHSSARGLAATIYFPNDTVPDLVYGGYMGYYSIRASWDCGYFFTSYGNWDKACSYDDVTPFPHGLSQTDSVNWQLRIIDGDFNCTTMLYVPEHNEACGPANTTRENFGTIVRAWDDAAPDVGVGTSVDNVTVKVTPSHDAQDGPSAPGAVNLTNSTIELPPGYETLSPDASNRTRLGDEPRDTNATNASVGGPQPPAPLGPAGGGPPTPPRPLSPSRVIAVLVGLAAGASILGLVILVLYFRIKREDALANRNRLRVYEQVKNAPGIRGGTIAKNLGLSYETTQWHLNVLRQQHMIEGQAQAEGSQVRYFLNGGSYSRLEKREILATSAPTAKLVLDHVRKHGPTPLADIGNALGLPKQTVSESVQRLVHGGLLDKERAGRAWIVRLAGSGGLTYARPATIA